MRCVIAGGGTGGHLFPGMAIADAFVEKEMGNEVLFIGTERGIESRVLALAGGKFPLRTIQVRPLKGRSFWAKGKGPVDDTQGHLGGLFDLEGVSTPGGPGRWRIRLRTCSRGRLLSSG